MIKSIRVNPVSVNLDGDSSARVFVEVDVVELCALVEKNGFDPEHVSVPYVVVDNSGNYEIETINLKAAVDTGHEVSNYVSVLVASVDGGAH